MCLICSNMPCAELSCAAFGVIAEPRNIRVRADDGDARDVLSQWQKITWSFFNRHMDWRGGFQRESGMRLAMAHGGIGIFIHEGMIKKAEHEFHAQHAADGLVQRFPKAGHFSRHQRLRLEKHRGRNHKTAYPRRN